MMDPDKRLEYVLHPDEIIAYRVAGEAVGARAVGAQINRVSLAEGLDPMDVRDKDSLIRLAGDAACALFLGACPSPANWDTVSAMVVKPLSYPNLSLEQEVQVLSKERVEVNMRLEWRRAMHLCLRKSASERIQRLVGMLLEQGEVEGDTLQALLRDR
jgi:hypothetical protein